MSEKKVRPKEAVVKLTVRFPKSVYDAMGEHIARNPHLSLNALSVIAVQELLSKKE